MRLLILTRHGESAAHVEPDLDEIRSGAFDGAPMGAYWAWRARHSSSERFPYLLDEDAVHRAAQCLCALPPFAARAENRHHPVTTNHLGRDERAGRGD